jgi:hypothetical protein
MSSSPLAVHETHGHSLILPSDSLFLRWLTQLLARRPFKVGAIALANKMARVAWALIEAR